MNINSFTSNKSVEMVDLLVVGGGKAGKTLAMQQAKKGKKVVMIERGMIGGTCINVACIPTKSLVASGRLNRVLKESEKLGVKLDGTHGISLEALRRHKEGVVGTMSNGNHKAFLASGMDFIIGEAKFVGKKTVEVNGRRICGEKVVINTGMVPLIPKIEGMDQVKPWTSETILKLESLPDSVIVLGGGYIGCEFAQILNNFGVKVTLLQGGGALLDREDVETSRAVLELFEKEGIDVRLNARVSRVGRVEEGVVVEYGSERVVGKELLVATGRRVDHGGLNLEATGVKTNEKGIIVVDEYLETCMDGVFAVGDVAGTLQFTHASWDDYRILRDAFDGKKRSTKGRLIPYTVFLTPELGRVGMTEREALETGLKVRTAMLPVSSIPRAKTLREEFGFYKVVVGEDDGILGACIFGGEGGEVVTAVQMAMLGGLKYWEVRDAVISHPTMGEGLNLLMELIQ